MRHLQDVAFDLTREKEAKVTDDTMPIHVADVELTFTHEFDFLGDDSKFQAFLDGAIEVMNPPFSQIQRVIVFAEDPDVGQQLTHYTIVITATGRAMRTFENCILHFIETFCGPLLNRHYTIG